MLELGGSSEVLEFGSWEVLVFGSSEVLEFGSSEIMGGEDYGPLNEALLR